MNEHVRGFAVPAVFAAVAAVEARMELSPRAAPATYWRLGDWFVESGFLWRSLLGRDRYRSILPYFAYRSARRGLSRLAGDWRRGRRIAATVRASAICVRNHVRLFYPAATPASTAKVFLSRTRSFAEFRNDLTVRANMRGDGPIRVPEIYREALSGTPPFFVEQLLRGRRLYPREDAALIRDRFCPALLAYYEQNGLAWEPASQAYRWEGPAAWIHFLFQHLPPVAGVDRETFLRAATRAGHSPAPVLVAYGHADLGFSNLLLGPGDELYVIDWEKSRRLPVFLDLLKLLVELPSLPPRVRAWAEPRLAAQPSAHSFETQWLLATLDYLRAWAESEAAQTSGERDLGHRAALPLAYWERAHSLMRAG